MDKQKIKKMEEYIKQEFLKEEYKHKVLNIAIFIVLFFLAMRNIYDTEITVTAKLENYLNKKYNDEFHVYSLREVEGAYKGNIKKESKLYEGDTYYHATITMNVRHINFGNFNIHGKIYDTYGEVILNKKLNNIVGKEIKKIFGNNYIPALNIKLNSNLIQKERELLANRKILSLKENEVLDLFKRNKIEIIGDIYVFGRVENDEDRELYREKIYKFTEYLKKEKIFDTANLGVIVADERFLANKFDEKVFLNFYEADSYDDKINYRNDRRELIKKYNDSFNRTMDITKIRKIDKIKRSDLFGSNAIGIDEYTGRNELLRSQIVGDNYLLIENYKENLIKSGIISKDYKGIQSINDIYFLSEKY